MEIQVNAMKLYNDIATPRYAYPGDACFDIAIYCSPEMKPYRLAGPTASEIVPDASPDGTRFVTSKPRETVSFTTGLAFEIPEGHVMLIYARSSTGFRKQIVLSNGTAVIDSGYRGEVRLAFTNIGNETGVIESQAIVIPFPKVELVEVRNLTDSLRGENVIGSSGK